LRFSDENRLLLNCLMPKLDEEAARRTRDILKKRLDWTYIPQSADENEVAAPFYHGLKEIAGEDAVPDRVRAKLTKIYHRVGFQNALFFEELENVLRSFDGLNIDVIVLKGAALAQEVWRNVALREMSDIDLLVREKDLQRADEALSGLGYDYFEGYRPREWYEENHHHLAPRYKPGGGTAIEIHRSLTHLNRRFHIDIDRVWRRASTIKTGDVDTQILSPEDLITCLCLHISDSDHFIGKIKTLADIGRAVEYYGPSINWSSIVTEAGEGGFARLIYYPLFFVEDILGVKIEKGALDELRDAFKLKPWEDRLLKLIVRRNIIFTDTSSRVFPKWFLKDLCRQLLRKDDTHGEKGSLLKTVVRPRDGSETHPNSASLRQLARLRYPIVGFAKLILRLGGIAIRTISHRVSATFAR